MMKNLEKYFESKIEVPLIRHRKKQKIETLINEEALMLAKFLRSEIKKIGPRKYIRAAEYAIRARIRKI